MTKPSSVKVQSVDGGWNLVACGCWEISVGPDGLIMLPRHLDPDELDDFVEAMKSAAVVATETRAKNAAARAKRASSPGYEIASTLLMKPSGDVPDGAIPLRPSGDITGSK